MAAIAKFLAPFVPMLFDYFGKKLYDLGRYFGRKYTSAAKKRKSKSEVDAHVDRYLNAVRKAYDGNDILPEEKVELDAAFDALIGNY